jgi:threonine synthase
MITVQDANVHVYRTEGTSDEQASVLKDIFKDEDFVKANNICSVNSINWARIAAQSSYYIWAYLQIYGTSFSIGKPVNFCIPTGAFGNAMGAYVAKMMGLPIGRIFCATNENDIVCRTINRGDLSMGSNVEVMNAISRSVCLLQYLNVISRTLYRYYLLLCFRTDINTFHHIDRITSDGYSVRL